MVSKNQQKIGEANGMINLPIVPTQVTLKGNVGSLDAPINILCCRLYNCYIVCNFSIFIFLYDNISHHSSILYCVCLCIYFIL